MPFVPRTPGSGEVVGYFTLRGIRAGAICGAVLGTVWMLGLTVDDGFDRALLGFGLVSGAVLGVLAGAALGLLTGLAVAAIVRLSTARHVNGRDFGRITGVTLTVVILLGAWGISPVAGLFLVFSPGYVILVAVALAALAGATSWLFCRWYWRH